MTQVSILEAPPTSGTVVEHHFDARGECTWVLFDPPSSEPWVGVFGKGSLARCNRVAVFSNATAVCVIAGGQGYVVDLNERQIRYRTDVDNLSRVLAASDGDFVVVCDFWNLEVLGPEGLRWRSDRVALDGIILDRATKSEVTGKAWHHDGWHSFRVEVDRWRLVPGPLLSKDWKAFDDLSG